ncbi:MAG: H-X9-DG-CTERM domain-containing protein [Verrucomicrobiia bacterium]
MKSPRGFSLPELLTGTAIVVALLAIALSALQGAMRNARSTECLGKIRALGQAFLVYLAEHQGTFPRSWHSAGSHGEPGWAFAVAPYLGVTRNEMDTRWPVVFQRHYRSPVDKESNPFAFSYALNVYFELDPQGDDYPGSPETWRQIQSVARPSRTVLLAQSKPVNFGDHLMCHLWSAPSAARNALNATAHRGKAHYLFVDGHVERLLLEHVFSPTEHVNLFHPSLSR